MSLIIQMSLTGKANAASGFLRVGVYAQIAGMRGPSVRGKKNHSETGS